MAQAQLNTMHEWHVYSEFEDASKAAADFLANKIESCIKQKGICHVILPGGNSPKSCLGYLATKPLAWKHVHWYLGDERCYPQEHPDRNDVMLQKNLWSLISDTNIHIIPAELGAEEAAALYRNVISSVEYFDIAFLGIGEDGHTASLFPGNEALHDTRSVIPVHHSPKPPSERVSLSVTTLRNAHCRLVLAGGSAKASIIAMIKNGAALPINSLGDIQWYLDEAAVL